MAVDSLRRRRRALRAPRAARRRARARGQDRPRTLSRRPSDFDHIVVLGMGGSGIAGDVLQAVGTASLPVPLTVLKHYRTPAFVGAAHARVRALVLGRHRGDARDGARRARRRRRDLVAISRGGALAELAREHGALHVDVPDGRPVPRFALGVARRAAVRDAVPHGLAARGARHVARRRSSSSQRRRDQCRPEVDAVANPARELARRIGRTIPLIYGGGGFGAVAAMRWKCSMNENAKAPAFWNVYPELDHNEICGWGQHGDVTRQVFTLVELRHGLEHPQLERRMAATPRADRGGAAPGARRSRPRARAASRSCSTSSTSATGRATTSRSTTTSIPGPIDAIAPAQGVSASAGSPTAGEPARQKSVRHHGSGVVAKKRSARSIAPGTSSAIRLDACQRASPTRRRGRARRAPAPTARGRRSASVRLDLGAVGRALDRPSAFVRGQERIGELDDDAVVGTSTCAPRARPRDRRRAPRGGR